MRLICSLILMMFGINSVTSADTEVGGPLPSGRTTTWTVAGSPYRVIQNVEVPPSTKLVIESGVEIRFGKYSLIVNGCLVAQGTAQQPILFTSEKNEKVPGQWGSIQFNPSSEKGVLDSTGQRIQGCLLEYATIEYGQGVIVQRASPVIRNCRIQHNRKHEGAAIFSLNASPLIQNCLLLRNQCERSGGAIRTIGGQPTIRGCEIRFNTALRGAGGGISSDFSSPTIENNTITHNMATEGGGIATGIPHGAYLSTAAHSSPQILGNSVHHNFAKSSGGGIYVIGSPKIVNNVISNNRIGPERNQEFTVRIHTTDFAERTTTRKGVGAGIYIANTFGGQAQIAENKIIANRGAKWGGGLHLSRGSAIIARNLFARNEANHGGGGATIVFVAEHQSPGSLRHGLVTEVSGNEFVNNQGGALEFAGNGKHSARVVECCFFRNAPFQLINHAVGDVDVSACHFESHEPLDLQKAMFDYYDNQAFGKLVLGQNPPEVRSLISQESHRISKSIVCAETIKLEAENSILTVPNSRDIVLAWQPCNHPDVAGYLIYFIKGGTLIEAPFGVTSASDEGLSPIDVGKETAAKLTGLTANAAYYLAVSAYDSEGQESGFSNIVLVRTERNEE